MRTTVRVWQLGFFLLLAGILNPFYNWLAPNTEGAVLFLCFANLFLLYRFYFRCGFPRYWRRAGAKLLGVYFAVTITSSIIGYSLDDGGVLRPKRYSVFQYHYGLHESTGLDDEPILESTATLTSEPVRIGSGEYRRAQNGGAPYHEGEQLDWVKNEDFFFWQAGGRKMGNQSISLIGGFFFSCLDHIVRFILFDTFVLLLIFYALKWRLPGNRLFVAFSRGLYWMVASSARRSRNLRNAGAPSALKKGIRWLVYLGRKNGTYITCYPSGHKESLVTYKDGEEDGPCITWEENGQKTWESAYKGGKLNGLSTSWGENGQKEHEANYKDGQKNGLLTRWHENGQKACETFYKDGIVDGHETEWHENGKKKREVTLKPGNRHDYRGRILPWRHGRLIEWHENGQKSMVGTYREGEKDGLFTLWDENGNVTKKVTYECGKRIE